MKLIILDEKLQEITKFDSLKWVAEKNLYKTYPNVPDITEENKIVYNHFNHAIGIFSPTKELDDFYISYLNDKFLEFTSFTNNDLRSTLISDSILYFNKKVMLNILIDVFKNNKSRNIYFEFYNNNFLFRRLKLEIFKVNNFLYMLGSDETDYNIFSMKKNRFFEDYYEAIAIIQDNKIVKCNKKYLEIEYPKMYKDIIDKEIDYNYLNIKGEQIKKLNKTIMDILEQKSYIESFPFEIRNNNKLLHHFNLNFIYILYNNKPSVIIFFKDTTKEKLYLEDLQKALKKSLMLENNLKQVLKISKTAISFKDNEKFNRSSSIYDILKLDPEKHADNKNFLEFVVDEDIPKLRDTYKKCSPESPEAYTIIRCINKDKELVYIKCYIVNNYDDEGNELGCINFYEDITEEVEKNQALRNSINEIKKLKDNLNKIQSASKTFIGYKGLDYYKLTPEVYEILEIDPKDYKTEENILDKIVIPEDYDLRQDNVNSLSPENPKIKFVQRIKTGKGNMKYVRSVIHGVFDEERNLIDGISLNQDITEETKYQEDLKSTLKETIELNDNLERIQNASKTFITYSYDLKNMYWTPEIYNILEINKDYNNTHGDIVNDFIFEEDLKIRKEAISKITPKNPDVTLTQKIKTGKGNIKYIRSVLHHEYENNKFIKRIGFNQDITEEVTYQKQLQATLKDKNILLKEVHHRVKNNLQIILSLINLNIDFDTDTKNILLNTQNRIYAMALIHEKIYGSDSLSEVNMKEYIESLVSAILDLYESDIKTDINIDQINLHMEQSVPLGLIINELVTNTIKYAFTDRKDGNISIDFTKDKNCYKFLYNDDGIGLPDDIDIDNLTSLGLIVITNLTLQIGGTFSILDCEGAGFKIEFED